MSFPAGFLDELRGRLSLAQVVGRKVMWDNRKSNPGKGDMWAPCPFHQEKSASFHVDDRKGYYYCFGCHAKGDAISFVRETENVPFIDAIEILAREAGLPIPERDPRDQQRADERTELVQVMEQAVQWYRLQLKTSAATEARAYLVKRGLSDAALDRWDIGFAPPGWEGLREALTAKGVTEAQMLAAGLLKPSDKGRKPYDTFRNRIMFPIRDARGRAIAFGGRAMDPADSAKYLNSPETLLFDKGRTLFNLHRAREAVGKGHDLIVAEGYMDVIALSEAGFLGAVAPLGTAVTEDQLRLMWRMVDEPIIALDGDKAGVRAAMRVIDLALPLLEAGKSMRFAILPEGLDPDDLIRARGAKAMQAVLDAAQPMVSLFWRRETEGRVFDSPERRAALDKTLREQIRKIADPSVRAHYGEAIKELRWDLFRSGRKPAAAKPYPGRRPGERRQPPPEPARTETKSSALALGTQAEDHLRIAVILATLLSTPAVLPLFESELERMDCADPAHGLLRDAILQAVGHADLWQAVETRIGTAPLERLFATTHVAISPPVRRAGDVEVARLCVAEELAKLAARRGHAREIAEAVEDIVGVVDEGLTWRLTRAAQGVDSTEPKPSAETNETVRASNGIEMDKIQLEISRNLFSSIDFAKTRRGPQTD